MVWINLPTTSLIQNGDSMQIRTFRPEDQKAVIALWQRCGLTRPWNDPALDIERKCSEDPALFLVGIDEKNRVMASAMVGFDGHRGWLYYLAVDPGRQRAAMGVLWSSGRKGF